MDLLRESTLDPLCSVEITTKQGGGWALHYSLGSSGAWLASVSDVSM